MLPEGANVYGYQNFHLERGRVTPLPEDAYLAAKVTLLDPFFRPRFLKDRTLLDLGCNAGFFPFWAAAMGAREAHGVDLDRPYVEAANRLAKEFAFANVRVHEANVVDWKQAGDVVVATGLIHWIITCTASIGSLEKAVEWLRSLTKYVLLIEWVEPDDDAIRFFGHLSWEGRRPADAYDRSAFEKVLRANFKRVDILGQLRPTRFLYAAYVAPYEIDMTTPMPLLYDAATMVSSRPLAEIGGKTYWSRVYELPDRIVKQATDSLAQHEFEVLQLLHGPYFPRALRSQTRPGFSVLEIEKINGIALNDLPATSRTDPKFAHHFATDCLEILQQLQAKGVEHRDIRGENMIVRDGKPVLIDFGWSSAPGSAKRDPPGLGAEGRGPEGVSDVFALGRLLDSTFGQTNEAVSLLAHAMMGTPGSRVDDAGALKKLFDTLGAKPRSTEITLLRTVASLRREIDQVRSETVRLANENAKKQSELAAEAGQLRFRVAAMEAGAFWKANMALAALLHRIAPPSTRGALRLQRLFAAFRRLGRRGRNR